MRQHASTHRTKQCLLCVCYRWPERLWQYLGRCLPRATVRSYLFAPLLAMLCYILFCTMPMQAARRAHGTAHIRSPDFMMDVFWSGVLAVHLCFCSCHSFTGPCDTSNLKERLSVVLYCINHTLICWNLTCEMKFNSPHSWKSSPLPPFSVLRFVFP